MELQKNTAHTLQTNNTDHTSYLPVASLRPADILLPDMGADMKKWAVIACDQFTAQPEYWERVEDYVQDAPSMLRLIYPEIYLNTDDRQAYTDRIAAIQNEMSAYLKDEVLKERVHQGYVLTVRQTSAGERIGLVAELDLEKYDYHVGTDAPVRATEATVKERIPVRVGIREGASLESPHVMVLMDDPKKQLLEALYEERMSFEKLYDTDLMEDGGHVTWICGYRSACGTCIREIAEDGRRVSGYFPCGWRWQSFACFGKDVLGECEKGSDRRRTDGSSDALCIGGSCESVQSVIAVLSDPQSAV